jgi:hypothetical protein
MFTFGCGGASAPAADRVVTVAVDYATPPPAGSAIDIRVVEVSGPDRAIAQTFTAPATAGPFEIRVPANRVRDTQQYGLEIHVVQNGASLMRNREPYFVLTRGNPDRVTAKLAAN